jgi:protein-S-isoprenylcysteine O-methyltransferase Ste14
LHCKLQKMNLVFITNLKAFILFVVQYASLAFLLLTGPIAPGNPLLLACYVAGWVLGGWSILSMGIGNINAGPDPLPGGRLVKHGPYATIRHPMYAAILLVIIPLLINHFTFMRLAVTVLLTVNLILKIRYEEQRLTLSYCNKYRDYTAGTWQLIPYVF